MKNFSSFNNKLSRAKIEFETLLRESNDHKRKKSFHRHFENKILKPKLALTFNKKMEFTDLKNKYAKNGGQKKPSNRHFYRKNLTSNKRRQDQNLHIERVKERTRDKKAGRYKDLDKSEKSRVNLEPSRKSKNLISGAKILEIFASQTLNPLKKKHEKRRLEKGKKSRRTVHAFKPNNHAKSKFSNRKVTRKPNTSNVFGPNTYKMGKNIFLDSDTKKKISVSIKADKMPSIMIKNKPNNISKGSRRGSRRINPRTRDYNVSYSNHNHIDVSQHYRVKVEPIKSYSKIDNSAGLDATDKFFRIFKKKKQSYLAKNDHKTSSGPNIYKNQKARFKSFRQLTMHNHSKRNISRAKQQRRSEYIELGDQVRRLDVRDVVSDSKTKYSGAFKKKINVLSDDKLNLTENIYTPAAYRSQIQANPKKEKKNLTRKMEEGVEKFHKEYIKIDCIASDSDSDQKSLKSVDKISCKGIQDICSQEKKYRKERSKIQREEGMMLSLKNELASHSLKNSKKALEIEQKKSRKMLDSRDDTNLSENSQDPELMDKDDDIDQETLSESLSQTDGFANKIEAALREIQQEKGKNRGHPHVSKKIKRVRLIDTYNLGNLYTDSEDPPNQEPVNTQKLKTMLNHKENTSKIKKERPTQSQNFKTNQPENEWNSNIDQNKITELKYIEVNQGEYASFEIDNMSLQKSLNVDPREKHPRRKMLSQTKNDGQRDVKSKSKGVRKNRKNSESRNKDYLNHLLNYDFEHNYDSENLRKNVSKKPKKYQGQTRKKKKLVKRRSENGIPLKITSFREKALKGTFRKKNRKEVVQYDNEESTPQDTKGQINRNFFYVF